MNDDLLRESLQDLYEEAPCGYVFTLPDGTFARVNSTFLDWTGYSRGDLLDGTRFQQLLTLPGRIFYENQFAPLLRMQGFVREVAFDIVCKEAERLPVLMSSVQRTDDHGLPVVVASILFLASDRRAYEQELLRARQEAEELAAIVRMSSDAILRCSVDGTVETWNLGAWQMFGFSEQQAQGMTVQTLLPAVDDEAWLEIRDILSQGESVRRDTVGRRANGSSIDVSVSLAPHLGPLGELGSISAIIRDISEIKAVERLQSEFLAMTSHELRTPLTSIRGFAQLMRRRGVYNEAAVDAITAGAEQLGRLIDDLLLASRLEADRLDMRSTEVNLVDVVRAAVTQVAGADGSSIRVDAPDHGITVWGDNLRLGQVLVNLLTNAVKYSPEGGSVVVRVSGSDREASVSVIDQGVGIPEEDLPHLFSRFYRVAATAGDVQGAGLGLYIADHIARAHGGRLTVESEVGRGSVFTLSLPLHRTSPEDMIARVQGSKRNRSPVG